MDYRATFHVHRIIAGFCAIGVAILLMVSIQTFAASEYTAQGTITAVKSAPQHTGTFYDLQPAKGSPLTLLVTGKQPDLARGDVVKATGRLLDAQLTVQTANDVHVVAKPAKQRWNLASLAGAVPHLHAEAPNQQLLQTVASIPQSSLYLMMFLVPLVLLITLESLFRPEV